MPLFCRHNRFEANCPICAREKAPAQRGRAGAPKRVTTTQRRPPGVVTRKLARATDDGYRNELVPGIKATADAERLAQALTIATQALEERAELTRAEAAELAFGDATAIQAWNPPEGDSGWTPQRRFDRWLDRLRLPSTTRSERFAFLVALGPAENLEAGALYFDTKGNDATTLAAKRALNSGDAALLERRAQALAEAAGVPIAALDRALALWDGTEALEVSPHEGAAKALRL